MQPTQHTESFNQEIAELEAKLAAKKKELLGAGAEHSEKDVFKQVVKEHGGTEIINTAIPTQNATSSSPTSSAPQVSPATTAKINKFIEHAFTHGITSAVKEAKKTGDAYFIDLLHDRLTDEYYEKLLQARKINPS